MVEADEEDDDCRVNVISGAGVECAPIGPEPLCDGCIGRACTTWRSGTSGSCCRLACGVSRCGTAMRDGVSE